MPSKQSTSRFCDVGSVSAILLVHVILKNKSLIVKDDERKGEGSVII